MSVQYQTVVPFDVNLRDAEFTDTDTLPAALQGLVIRGVYITDGAPTVVAGKYLVGAEIINAIDGETYKNVGTTAVPSFAIIDHTP